MDVYIHKYIPTGSIALKIIRETTYRVLVIGTYKLQKIRQYTRIIVLINKLLCSAIYGRGP